jgi:sensor histidine kinase YesM
MPQVRSASWAYWRRILLGNVLASAAVVFAFSGVTFATPPLEILRRFALSFFFSCCIAAMLGWTMPRLSPWLWRTFPFPLNWLAAVVVMATLGVAGAALAITLLTAAGLLEPEAFGRWLSSSIRVTISVTVTIGLFITAYEMMRSRLERTALALRTKERDEADARRLAAEAQLASIESRVQPHFLFNTLNSIAALVHDDPAGAERMTGQLSALLRSALDSTAMPLVQLNEELRIVRAYLDIERVRFGERLRYDVQAGADILTTQVPRMALQTLVENSVKYAVSPRREGGSIRVHALAVGDRVRIAVEDDGPGFEAAQRPPGHGLALLDARLTMLYGGQASMQAESEPGRTRITLDVPRR